MINYGFWMNITLPTCIPYTFIPRLLRQLADKAGHPGTPKHRGHRNFIRDLSVYAIHNRYLLRYLKNRPTQIFISFVNRTKNRIDTEILIRQLTDRMTRIG